MFEPLNLSANYKIAIALLSGMMLGFLLIKSDLAWRESWLDFFLLRSGRIIKTLLMIVILGSVIFFFARNWDMVSAHVPKAYFWTSLIGGAISGLGIAMAGVIPLTAVANLAAGRVYALAAIIGMLLAVPVMHWTRVALNFFVSNWGGALPGPSTASEFLSISNPALWTAGIGLALLGLVYYTLGDEK